MSDDDTTNGEGVDEADEKDERDEVVMQDRRVEVEIEGDEGPGVGEGEKADEGVRGVLVVFATVLHDVESAKGGREGSALVLAL